MIKDSKINIKYGNNSFNIRMLLNWYEKKFK